MGNFTAGMFKNYKHSVEELVDKNQGFYFINQIRGTQGYWKSFQFQVLAMIKQFNFRMSNFLFNFILRGLEMERNIRN